MKGTLRGEINAPPLLISPAAMKRDAQVIVPWMTVPFLSSIVTVSLLSFIKNLGMVSPLHNTIS
jgi:hypothetical protein